MIIIIFIQLVWVTFHCLSLDYIKMWCIDFFPIIFQLQNIIHTYLYISHSIFDHWQVTDPPREVRWPKISKFENISNSLNNNMTNHWTCLKKLSHSFYSTWSKEPWILKYNQIGLFRLGSHELNTKAKCLPVLSSSTNWIILRWNFAHVIFMLVKLSVNATWKLPFST